MMLFMGSTMTRAGTRLTGVLLLASVAGVGMVGAETFRHNDSTAIIQQQGGSGRSESRVERYPDGQKIITRDGANTDITIQRKGSAPRRDDHRARPGYHDDGAWSRFFHWRFSGVEPDDRGRASQREDFKQRMRDRMRGDYPR